MTTHSNDRRDEMPIHKTKTAKFRPAGQVTHGVIHQTGVEWGETADQHVRFHISPERYDADSKPLNVGRNWPTGAYTSYVGKDGRRELLLDYEVIGNHCKGVNYKSIGVVAEGAFHIYAPSEAIVQGVVDECLWHEANLGRRLIWTWHDVVRPDWNCPGEFFPKEEVLRRIEEGRNGGSVAPKEPHVVFDDPKEPPVEPPLSGCGIETLRVATAVMFIIFLAVSLLS